MSLPTREQVIADLAGVRLGFPPTPVRTFQLVRVRTGATFRLLNPVWMLVPSDRNDRSPMTDKHCLFSLS